MTTDDKVDLLLRGRIYRAWYGFLMRLPVWLGLALMCVLFGLAVGAMAILRLGWVAWPVGPVSAVLTWPLCAVLWRLKGYKLGEPPPAELDRRNPT